MADNIKELLEVRLGSVLQLIDIDATLFATTRNQSSFDFSPCMDDFGPGCVADAKALKSLTRIAPADMARRT